MLLQRDGGNGDSSISKNSNNHDGDKAHSVAFREMILTIVKQKIADHKHMLSFHSR